MVDEESSLVTREPGTKGGPLRDVSEGAEKTVNKDNSLDRVFAAEYKALVPVGLNRARSRTRACL